MKTLIIALIIILSALLLANNPTSAPAASPIRATVDRLPPMTYNPAPTSKPVPVKVQKKRYITMEVTAYCPCKICCGRGAKGLAADGSVVYGKRLIAADWSIIPKHSILNVPGYGVARVRDTGSDIVGHRLDVYFDSHQTAKEWGRQFLKVEIVK